MTTDGNNKQRHITDEDISAAYGGLKTHHKQIPLTKSVMREALGAAVQDINRFTIAITTMFEQDELAEATFDDLRPGTGVLVEAKGVYGIVTAGHVLNKKDKLNRKEKNIRYHKNRCTIGVMPLANERSQTSKQPYFRIRQRRCCAYGVDNEDDSGPDIAYIPLTPREWDLMEQEGVRAWPALEEPDPVMPPNTKEEILLDCCAGANYKATRTLEEAHPEIRPAIVCQGVQILELARDRTDDGSWDYTKLTLEGDERGGSTTAEPSLNPAQTLRDFLDHDWHKLQPREMLGGLSGTGLWSARIRVSKNGNMSLHTKRLKGILFHAGPSLEAKLHGRKSIKRIISEGLDLHGQAAMDEAEALSQMTTRTRGAHRRSQP